ncbi:1,4-alpha-glucan branching protein GlgB [Kineococcus rubinsiae]|uniref:1,4-alpha-glucan branching protein GlgB n=2 Tax=Kineococcus rubinsiae TaxID=2609562 RepID=UPI001431C87C|nr:1,4-alpha-glucan branching protein GlgB [Kineococcus rubinsiae]NIZ92990.1 1,4-alpha-glucan branching protein GlgB [Kineococcus rubinsiae]
MPSTSSTPPAPAPVDTGELARVAAGAHWSPHSVLGAHPHEGGVTYRTLKPFAASVAVTTADGTRVPLVHEYDGVWVGVQPDATVEDYRLEVTYPGGEPHVLDDPYRFLPTVGSVDLHLIGEGRHEELWNVLGAHVHRWEGPLGPVQGTSFAVWAPNAQAVRVVGDHNHWNGRTEGMRSLGSSGVWEIFLPGVGAGSRYKFEILGADGQWRQKADPMAQATEVPPATASVVTESSYEWSDAEWMTARAASDPHAGPVSVYEVHLGSWRQGLSYQQLAVELVDYVKSSGFTHVEFLPVMEHPFGGSWGYQVTGFFAPTSRFGSPDDFRHLVDALHRAGIGVILDWVPGHFPKDEFALGRFDGTPLYEHGDPRRGEQMDWGTYVFDFGRSEVRNFLVASGLYWLEEFHADGLRVDAVASMLYLDYSREEGQWEPNVFGGRENLEAIGFLQEANATAYKRTPGIMMIAEESTAFPGVTAPTSGGGLGFGLKWNMGWMHDSLAYVSQDPVNRQYHHGELTFSLVYAFTENFTLPISHDEVVHGKGSLLRKMPGDRWQQLANVRAYLAYMWSHPGKQLLFMGAELGQEAEWSESRSLDWWLLDTPWHQGLQRLVTALNTTYKARPELWSNDFDSSGFSWIDGGDNLRNVLSYARFSTDGTPLVAICNFSGAAYEDFRVGLPTGGTWRELLNTDAEEFAGSGVVNTGPLTAEAVAWNGQEQSVQLRVPPLGVTWLVPDA